MKILLLFIFTLCLIPAGAGAVTTVTGYRGGSVQIRCNYTAGSEKYSKYLCRGYCSSIPWDPDEVARSGSDPKDKRFSQYDNTADKVFIVTITDLRAEDAGTYWCIVFRYYINGYTRVDLRVKTDDPARRILPTNFPLVTHTVSTSVPVHTAQHGSRQRSSPGVAVVGVGLILLAAGVIVAFYWKMRSRGPRPETQTSTPTNGEKDNNQNKIPLPPRTDTKPSEPIYQDLDPESMQPDSEYQSLNPKTSQSDPVYQDVDPNSMQPDSEYQNLNPKTN